MGLDLEFYDEHGQHVHGFRCNWFREAPWEIRELTFRGNGDLLTAAEVADLWKALLEYRRRFIWKEPAPPDDLLALVKDIYPDDGTVLSTDEISNIL